MSYVVDTIGSMVPTVAVEAGGEARYVAAVYLGPGTRADNPHTVWGAEKSMGQAFADANRMRVAAQLTGLPHSGWVLLDGPNHIAPVTRAEGVGGFVTAWRVW